MEKTVNGPRPWFKEPWPWLLMIIPLVSVIVGVSYLTVAIKTDDGLVTDDYYKKGKAINMELRRDNAAAAMGITAQVMFGGDGKSLRVVTTSQSPLPDTLLLRLIHPAQDDFDLTAELKKSGDNMYQGTLTKVPVKANHWYVQLEDKGNKWRVQSEWKTSEGPMVMLGKPKLEAADN